MEGKSIAMVSFHTCPLASLEGKETGGMNVYVLELSKQLPKLGFNVDVFTRSQDPGQPKIVKVTPGFRVIHLTAGPQAVIPKKNNLFYVAEFVDNFLKFSRKENKSYDLLHCHYYLSGLAGLSIREKVSTNFPIVMTFHTLALMKNLVARDEHEAEETKRVDSERLLTKLSDKIIATSESDKEYLQYLYECAPSKISVVSPGIDTDLFKPIDKKKSKKIIGANLNHKIVLFVGRIEPVKGIDVLLYAMKILLSRNPKFCVCLWIVGGDVSQKPYLWSRELKKLEELRRTLNIETVVRFVGQKPQSELPYYFGASELVVIPSHYESFGMSAIEVMACGVPVITTNVSGVSSILDEKYQALITSPNNPLLLAKRVEYLLSNQKEHEILCREVFKKVQNLTWGNIAKIIIGIYNQSLPK